MGIFYIYTCILSFTDTDVSSLKFTYADMSPYQSLYFLTYFLSLYVADVSYTFASVFCVHVK
jgi:hypothetical protein